MNDFVSILKALADENRFQIINLLLTHDLCVGALACHLDISKAAVSQHLRVLRKAGLVKGEKRGYWTHYSVERSALNYIGGSLMQAANQTLSAEAICPKGRPYQTDILERREMTMCKNCCEHPEKLKGKPEECSEEQIKECHGDVNEHPCKSEKK
jgi:ArsR family transcriptional regulator, arsenate/arsenite/antimonite-responsive transcriptional repressor